MTFPHRHTTVYHYFIGVVNDPVNDGFTDGSITIASDTAVPALIKFLQAAIPSAQAIYVFPFPEAPFRMM